MPVRVAGAPCRRIRRLSRCSRSKSRPRRALRPGPRALRRVGRGPTASAGIAAPVPCQEPAARQRSCQRAPRLTPEVRSSPLEYPGGPAPGGDRGWGSTWCGPGSASARRSVARPLRAGCGAGRAGSCCAGPFAGSGRRAGRARRLGGVRLRSARSGAARPLRAHLERVGRGWVWHEGARLPVEPSLR